MAHLNGVGRAPLIMRSPGSAEDTNVGIDVGGPAQTATPIDGTPVRVVLFALSGAAGLIALRMAGLRFNVGVSA